LLQWDEIIEFVLEVIRAARSGGQDVRDPLAGLRSSSPIDDMMNQSDQAYAVSPAR
jgi:hypothetical protein